MLHSLIGTDQIILTTDLRNLSESGDNIASPDGYYFITVDADAMTYTALATEWGIIGDATPNGWDDETALTYDATAAMDRRLFFNRSSN